jgi:hypothetical protein
MKCGRVRYADHPENIVSGKNWKQSSRQARLAEIVTAS